MEFNFNSGLSRTNQSRLYNQQRNAIFAPVQTSRYDSIVTENQNQNQRSGSIYAHQQTRSRTRTHHRSQPQSQSQSPQRQHRRQHQHQHQASSIYTLDDSNACEASIIERNQDQVLQLDADRYNPNVRLLENVNDSIRAINRDTTHRAIDCNYADYNDTESEYKNVMATNMARSIVNDAYRNFDMLSDDDDDALYNIQCNDSIPFEVSYGRSALNKNVANNIVSTYD